MAFTLLLYDDYRCNNMLTYSISVSFYLMTLDDIMCFHRCKIQLMNVNDRILYLKCDNTIQFNITCPFDLILQYILHYNCSTIVHIHAPDKTIRVSRHLYQSKARTILSGKRLPQTKQTACLVSLSQRIIRTCQHQYPDWLRLFLVSYNVCCH